MADTEGATGASGTTYGGGQLSVSTTSNGAAQPLLLTAALYANSTTPLTAAYAGLWTYSFSVSLEF